jgi:hypothetical protein
MMAEGVHPEIAAALAKLAQQDAGSAGNAEAALEWIAGELGLAAITQVHVQNFCWYQLPMKWLISHEEKLRVAVALGEVLDLLQLPRYASICRSQATREILGAHEESSRLGKAAFRRAAVDSGITSPDLPDFEWSATMGPQEASAWSSVAGSSKLPWPAAASFPAHEAGRSVNSSSNELTSTFRKPACSGRRTPRRS